MKTKLIPFFSFLFFLLYSCSENDLLLDDSSGNNSIQLRSGGDGVYDILGYGYDCTQSNYYGTEHARLPVIDVTSYLNAGNLIHDDNLPNQIYERTRWGADYSLYQSNMQSDIEVKNTTPIGKVKLFTGRLKMDFTKDEKITTNTAFYEYFATKATRKIQFAQTDPTFFKNLLTSTFKYDISTKSGIELVRKYGTHVLTDIKLGGVSSILFYAKLVDQYNFSSFKLETELTYLKLKANGGTTNKTTTLTNHKDMQILVSVMGGDKAVETGKLTFNPFENTVSNITFSYTEWLNSIVKPYEQIIGIGNPNTIIYPLSEFIFDNPQKKKEVENALEIYAKEKEITIPNKSTIDYLTLEIKDPDNNYLGDISTKINGIKVSGVMWSNTPYKWTFYPEGEQYRIKGGDKYLTRDSDGYIIMTSYSSTNPSQLWSIEKATNNASCPFRIKDPLGNQVLTRYTLVHKVGNKKINTPSTKMDLWNPYDTNKFWNIK